MQATFLIALQRLSRGAFKAKGGRQRLLASFRMEPSKMKTFAFDVCKVVIKFYQYFISPLLPNACKFEPSCSNYTIKALDHYGFLKGLMLSFSRICRCNPWGKGGYDPVPKKINSKTNKLQVINDG